MIINISDTQKLKRVVIEFVDDECQSILDEKERKVLNSLN